MSTKKTTRTTSTGVDNLIDSAFVPNMEENNKSEDKSDLGLMNNLLSELAAGKGVVDSGYRADPEDGEHKVVIKEYREGKGRNGKSDYLVFTLKDVATGRLWDTFVSVSSTQDVVNFINTVSANNAGVFEGTKLITAFQKLTMGKQAFFVWTAKRERDGRILTFSDQTKYEKYLYWRAKEAHKEEERRQREQERKALAKSKDAISRRAPWEDAPSGESEPNTPDDNLISAREARKLDGGSPLPEKAPWED